MKFLIPGIILIIFFSGCEKSRDELITASNDFKKLFLNEISTVSSVDTTSGRTDYSDVYMSKSEFLIHNEAFNPSTTYNAGRAALSKWKMYEEFGIKSSGGGGNHFFINYGSGGKHVFIDIIGYSLNGQMKIDFIVRGD